MNRAFRCVAATLAAAACLWPVAAAAQDAQPASSPVLTIDQVRSAYAGAGYQVDEAITWDWTSPPVTSFQVHDLNQGRVLMVLVYPSTTAAVAGRLQAEARDDAIATNGATFSERGPHLVVGYGQSVWRGNVALVETMQSELDRVYRWQTDRDDGVYVDPAVQREPGYPAIAVDFDFQQALDTSVANL